MVIFFVVLLCLIVILRHLDLDSLGESFSVKKIKGFYRDSIVEEDVKKRTLARASNVRTQLKWEKRYSDAGLNFKFRQILGIKIFICAAFVVLSIVVFQNVIISITMAVLGYVIPDIMIVKAGNKRRVILDNQVGIFMQKIVNRFEITEDFDLSLRKAVEAVEGELIYEKYLTDVSALLDTGTPISSILHRIAINSSNCHLEVFADYYDQGVDIGSFEALLSMLKQALSNFEREKENQSEARKKLSSVTKDGMIMVVAVPVLFLLEAFTNENYLDTMLNTVGGQICTSIVLIILLFCVWFIMCKVNAPIDVYDSDKKN